MRFAVSSIISRMFDAAFRDCRLDAVDRFEASPAHALVPFTVLVRRDDGVLVRFDVLDASRYLAARTAEEMLHVRQERRGTTAVVSMAWDPREPIGVGEELQEGPADFTVLVENAAGLRTCIGVTASGREAALELATRATPGCRPVLARVRYVCLGRCSFCGVALFADMKIRETRRGRK